MTIGWGNVIMLAVVGGVESAVIRQLEPGWISSGVSVSALMFAFYLGMDRAKKETLKK